MRLRVVDHGWRIGIAALVAALSVAAAQPPAAEFAELDTLARAELQAINAPGAAIAIVKGDRVVYQTAVGVANVETGQAVTADMLFRIGSVTKMFTTAALVSLAEEGKLKLDEPIGKYTAGLHGKLSRLTAHQLMSHTGGIRDEAPAFGSHDETALAATVEAWGDDFNGSTRIDLVVRDGKLFFRRGAQEAEVVKTGPMRFSMTAPGAPSAQTLALVPGADGAVAYLHTGSRALKKGPPGPS